MIQLPVKDRAYLAERLLASLDESDVEQQWAEVALKRRDEIRSGRVKAIPSEDVYREIDELLIRRNTPCIPTQNFSPTLKDENFAR